MKRGKFLIWLVFVGCMLSGIALYLTQPATMNDFPHPLHGEFRFWHGLFVFLSLVSFGQTYNEHIRKQIKKWRSTPDGALHLVLWLLLMSSGLLLYYPPMWLTDIVSIASLHWYFGLLLGLILPLHILRHRSKAKSTRNKFHTVREQL
ncbi:hypothetical protein ACFOEE_04090 [Pseudoalteromonas fenneropenaei]|uniref:DUF4405 domain-containing protein n=1 Tax=Pseudoalteromonas fenneropenaei TaxID=1737459 RepID=A0ABV7CGG9_9GAMM